MNFGHVCASLLWLGSVLLGSGALLYYVHKVDEEFGRESICRIQKHWLLYTVLTSLAFGPRLHESSFVVWIEYGVLAVYLIICSVMDVILKMICDFFHYIGIVGGGIYLLYQQPAQEAAETLLVFVGIQWIVFWKMYGPADVAAYIVCAMYLIAERGSLLDCLMHMMVTFVLLGLVQGCKINISVKGNLKNPVALLPYISIAFFLII